MFRFCEEPKFSWEEYTMGLLKKCTSTFNSILATICGFLISLIAIFMVIDIVGRTMRRPVHAVGELAVFALVMAAYMGLAQCEETKSHVIVDYFVLSFSKKWQRVLNMCSSFIALITVCILLYSVGMNALHSVRVGEYVAGPVLLPIYPVKIIMVIGIFAFLMQIFINFYDLLSRKENDE